MTKRPPQPIPPPAPKFRVGDWVSYYLWRNPPGTARVVRQSGPLGVGGEHIYQLREIDEWGQVWEFEQSESALRLASAPALTPATTLT